MEEEVQAEGPKEEEVGQQSPDLSSGDKSAWVHHLWGGNLDYLAFIEYELEIEVQGERGDQVQRACCRRQERAREVQPRDDRDLVVPLQRISYAYTSPARGEEAAQMSSQAAKKRRIRAELNPHGEVAEAAGPGVPES